ncbi:hypothetical protein [Leptospira alstonii]|uniref:hypothetical protein n=1 Tax=Leptospira alstonii TaxID=28452 RepID=UPI0009D91B99|nr:hypothetical protein [Leptospira alstonii]
MAETCKYSNLLKLREDFKKGITISEFIKNCDRKSLKYKVFDSAKNDIVYGVDIVPDCPESPRPYCGFKFTFRNERLVKIEAGYPCH